MQPSTVPFVLFRQSRRFNRQGSTPRSRASTSPRDAAVAASAHPARPLVVRATARSAHDGQAASSTGQTALVAAAPERRAGPASRRRHPAHLPARRRQPSRPRCTARRSCDLQRQLAQLLAHSSPPASDGEPRSHPTCATPDSSRCLPTTSAPSTRGTLSVPRQSLARSAIHWPHGPGECWPHDPGDRWPHDPGELRSATPRVAP